MPSLYANNEDHTDLWFEQAILASTHIGAVAYGLLIAIYYLAMYYSLKQKKVSWGWVLFNTTLVILGTVNLATSIHFNEAAWIDERNYPGGPYAFLTQEQDRAVQTVGNSASIISLIMAEGLLLYRVFIIWRKRWYIVMLPALLFLANIALSIVRVIQIALPSSPTWTQLPDFAFPVWMMLMVLNVLLTILLAVRLLYMRQKLRAVLGDQYGRAYTSITAMVVESALPFGILSIIFLVLFGKKDPTQNLFLPLLVQVECISPLQITLRVIRGRAWVDHTVPPARVSTLQFAAREAVSTSEGVGARQMTETNDFSDNTLKQISSGDIAQREDASDPVGNIV